MGHTILITGASGYLGSALCVNLSRHHKIIGLYKHPVPGKLKNAAPSVQWEKSEIADISSLERIFRQTACRGTPIDYVIHFAAYTGFGKKWEDPYCRTNVIGTRNIISVACAAGVERILFAGSIAALDPLPSGNVLTEKSPAGGDIAYSKSKAMGEKLLLDNSHRIPVVVLRLGGVFTDWCELPPLFSVMKLWSKPFIGRMMPGKGLSGFPYIHRKDVVRIVDRLIEKNNDLARYEILFASSSGCTCHRELFPIIRRECSAAFSTRPLPVPLPMIRMSLYAKFFINFLRSKNTYERPWMVDYVDRPLVVETAYTKKKLDWAPCSDLHILERLPLLVKNFNRDPRRWHRRNVNRNDQKYEYDPD